MKQNVYSKKNEFYEAVSKTNTRILITHPNIIRFINYSSRKCIDGKRRKYYLRKFY